ncbi:hypothetical protein [Leucobacter luti]|uniref:hypothetical protein n=1 Tax=Leucobacter luti TaxID=340320 RepID=UPI00105C67CB|nr:hypothetical protein [Leucobacter luti]
MRSGTAIPRWKQVCAVWAGMLPVNILVSWAIAALPWWGAVALPARSLILVSVIAPVMTCVMMPLVTRLLRPWLTRHPDRVQHERCLREALDQLAAPPQAGQHRTGAAAADGSASRVS